MLCDDRDGWEGGGVGRGPRGRGYIHILLIHFMVEQKLTEHCSDILKSELFSKEKKVRFTRNDFWSVFGENWMFLDIRGHQTLERDWR